MDKIDICSLGFYSPPAYGFTYSSELYEFMSS